MKCYIGIDPGQKGGLAALYPDHQENTEIIPMPTFSDGVLDIGTILSFFMKHAPYAAMTVIEKVHAMPKQGVSSTFKFGRNYGVLEGLIVAARLPSIHVTPQAWMKQMHKGIEGSIDTKKRSVLACARIFPNISLIPPSGRVPHDGMADATLMARYAQMNESGSLF